METITVKTFPISHQDSPHGQPISPPSISLSRRHLLRGSGVLMGTLLAGSPLALLAPSTVWAVELSSLTQAEGETLLLLGRVLFPHPQLPDAVYALLAKDLDAGASKDADTATLLHEGLRNLDQLAGGSFAKASADKRLEVVQSSEGQPFFNKVRGQCVTSLYDNEMAYTTFGYEGASWPKGGYITRGFQDLKWLPDPSAEASPPPYMG